VPAIIDKVKNLTVFQRTAQWMYPLDIKSYSKDDQDRFRKNPWIMKFLYQWNFFLLEQGFSRAVVGASKISKYLLDRACRQNLDRVKDPELKKKLTPDYEPGCKRLIFSTDYYDAIQKPNANLVVEDIERIEPEGVRTKDGELHELDVLVLSTGFKPDRFVRPMEVEGEGGKSLEQEWSDGPKAYHSVTVPHMPNFFMIIGPYSPIGNLSLISIAEYQVRYIMKLVDKIRSQKVSLSPLESATEAERQKMREQVKKTVWVSGGCQSWYLDKDGVPIIYPWEPSVFYRSMRKAPNLDDFQVKEAPVPVATPVAAE
jgi:cation diffusion facilitator CzcD-associated flavoprotein CzcO